MTERPKSPSTPKVADERTMLEAFLDHYRAELLDRAWGLDEADLHRPLPPSTLTLARLIAHMTTVEYGWFLDVLDQDPIPERYLALDWEADPDAEMTRADTLPAGELIAEFEAAVADSRRRTAAAESLDQLSAKEHTDGERWSLRWILVHMIEEYARHCGHADFLREAIDGDTAW